MSTLDAAYDDAFFDALMDQCPTVGIVPEDFLLLIAGECDFVWGAKNKYGFQGMTQMGGPALRAAGWDASKMGEFCDARPVVQLPYSLSYFRHWRKSTPNNRFENAGMLWLANLAPAHLKRTDGVVYSQSQHPTQYAANAGLDVDRDGIISVNDLTAKMRRLVDGTAPGRARTAKLYAEAVARLEDRRPRPAHVLVYPVVGEGGIVSVDATPKPNA